MVVVTDYFASEKDRISSKVVLDSLKPKEPYISSSDTSQAEETEVDSSTTSSIAEAVQPPFKKNPSFSRVNGFFPLALTSIMTENMVEEPAYEEPRNDPSPFRKVGEMETANQNNSTVNNNNNGASFANYEQNIQSQFERAVRLLQELPKDSALQPSNDEKLQFYGAFKQATVGPCDVPKPAFWDIVAKAKWDAWMNLKHLQKIEAMEVYIETLIQFLKRFPDRPQALEIITSFDNVRKDVLSGYFTAIESSSPENRPVGISSVPARVIAGKSNIVPSDMVTETSPKSTTTKDDVSTTPLYSNVGQSFYQNVMSRISSEPQVDLSSFQKVQESLHNMEYRMEKLENRINALTENVKQIVMDQRRNQKYPINKWTGIILLTALFLFFVSRRSQPMKVVGSLILSRIFQILKL